ncbi:hypothetical protein AABM38_22185 [Heyndrickxia sp. MSNUG]|uniref:hypothetical protein n=1 Tax=Heyndrickxia sp. MSNUG TaxID=3136677 RepID=UPI003C2E501B
MWLYRILTLILMFVNELRADLREDEISELVILGQCGHVCNIEKADDFIQISLGFMSKHKTRAKKVI